MAYKKLISPGAKKADAFVLGYYLPWLVFAKGLDDSVFSDHLALFDKFTLESYVFEAATKLQLGVDRDYVYNIKPNALVEKYSISQKLSRAKRKKKDSMALNFGISLSESLITFDDRENRNRCIAEAGILAHKLKLGDETENELKSLLDISVPDRFENKVEEIAIAFIKANGGQY